MAKLLANLFLMGAMMLVTLGNFWFTYGVWPRSWGAFVLFSFLGILIVAMRMALDKED